MKNLDALIPSPEVAAEILTEMTQQAKARADEATDALRAARRAYNQAQEAYLRMDTKRRAAVAVAAERNDR